MKQITLYNDQYEFTEKLLDDDGYVEDYIPHDHPNEDYPLSELPPDHPFLLGWFESISQSGKLPYDIEFTHIRYECK
jgi:hypothetical protein